MILNTAIFTATVAEAKAKAANYPAWIRAIDRAVVEIERARYWSFADGVLTLISTTSGKRYVIDDAHECEAKGKACKHRAARRLMLRYTERLAATKAATPEADERAEMIAALEGRWSRAYSRQEIIAGLVRRFGVVSLAQLSTDVLRTMVSAR